MKSYVPASALDRQPPKPTVDQLVQVVQILWLQQLRMPSFNLPYLIHDESNSLISVSIC